MAKGPKTLNPADKARKEARKKELKKNKKQRQQVRSAAIECRDPHQIIAELEQLDKLEFNPSSHGQQSLNSCPISDTLYKDKRKRLKELYSRILAHYEKEDPEKHAKLKALEAVYEAKHKRAQREFEAVKAAQEVRIEDVFLPPEQIAADKKATTSESVDEASRGVEAALPGQVANFKQLVESPKIPPSTFVCTHFLPANQRKRIHPGGGGSGGKFHQPNKPASRPTGGDLQQPAVVSHQHEQSKPAVIESKPVIFMPKVTKFVPASVRSKLGATKNKFA